MGTAVTIQPELKPHCHAIVDIIVLVVVVIISQPNAAVEEGKLGSRKTQCIEPAREQSTLMWY